MSVHSDDKINSFFPCRFNILLSSDLFTWLSFYRTFHRTVFFQHMFTMFLLRLWVYYDVIMISKVCAKNHLFTNFVISKQCS